MTNVAPGVYTSVTTGAPSINAGAPTGTWFVVGQPFAGATGTPIPVTSLAQFVQFCGPRVATDFLYDCLDEFFHDGGQLAYVSRIAGPSADPATVTLDDRAMSPLSTLTLTATGAGTWGNALSVVVANGSVSNSYTLQLLNGTTVVWTSPNLFSPADAVTYVNSLPLYSRFVTVTNTASATAAPNNNPAAGTFSLASGTDDVGGISETQWTNGLAVFANNDGAEVLGPGQVSAPGHTTTTGYGNLLNHALANNRVALLDVADSGTASSLITQAGNAQGAATDPSYGALFAPWVNIPGLASAAPGTSSPVPTRTIPPSALAAAVIARNDQTQDANNPAAGVNGASTYVIGTTHNYIQSDRANLNAAGVDVIRFVPSQAAIEVYGFRSLSLDPNWLFFNNVRMRMQMIYDCDNVGELFVFDEIDGNGQLFGRFAGALGPLFQQYWLNNSIFGTDPQSAYSVNTGPNVNTPATIAAGELNAVISVRLAPYGEVVNIDIVKYLSSQSLPVA